MSTNLIKLSVFMTLLFFNSSVFSSSWNIINISTWSTQTISELKGSLKELNNEKKWLDSKLNILKWNKRLNNLFKKDLSLSEIEKIKIIVNKYRKININLNIILNEKSKNTEDITGIRKEIIAQRINFYKKLIIYIDKNKLERYKSYVKSDTQILKDKKNINAKINISKKILQNKVNKIRIKIKKHDSILNEKLKIIIKNKIKEKIDNLKNNTKFKTLNNSIKKEVLLKTVEKIKIKIGKLYDIENRTTIILKKIEIYNIAIEKINELYSEY